MLGLLILQINLKFNLLTYIYTFFFFFKKKEIENKIFIAINLLICLIQII